MTSRSELFQLQLNTMTNSEAKAFPVLMTAAA
jgi:hypothetical protein